MKWPHHRIARVYLILVIVLFLATAINPHDRFTWTLENLLTVAGVTLLVLTRNILPLSRISYTLIFIYTCLHMIGAYYTYSHVPYDDWSAAVIGSSVSDWFGWERNHYDRLIHFLYGLLLAYPIREVIVRVASMRGFWGYFLPLDVTMSTSLMYELGEWAVAILFGEGSMSYLGTQGDQWDSHKDMALAALGALISMGVVVLIHLRWKRDFAREFVESLRVKRREPLGEDELTRLYHHKR